MNGWMIFALVLLVLFLLGQIRVGAEARYDQDGLLVRVRVGPLGFTVFPGKPKDPEQERRKKAEKATKKKAKAEKKKKRSEPEGTAERGQKKGKTLSLYRIFDLAERFVPLALEAAGCFYRKLVVDVLDISLTVGHPDPADAAMLYGKVHAALGAAWEPLTRAFHVKDGRGHVELDFNSQSLTLYARAVLTLKLGQVLWLGLHFGVKALKEYLCFRRSRKKKAKTT